MSKRVRRWIGPALALAVALALALIEGILPNRLGWGANFEEIAFNRGFDIPIETFTFTREHWVYPLLILAVIATTTGMAIYAIARQAPAGSKTRRAHSEDGTETLLLVFAVGVAFANAWILITAKFTFLEWDHFPPPVVIVQILGLKLKAGQEAVWLHFAGAAARTVLSLVLALAIVWPIAVWCGLRTGCNPRLGSWIVPYSYALSALPPIILFHLVNDFLSPGVLGKVLVGIGAMPPDGPARDLRDLAWLVNLTVTCWTVFWPIFAAAHVAAKSADRRLLAAAEQLGASPRVRFRKIIYPQALEQIYAGVGTSVTLGMVVLLYSEARSGVSSDPKGGNAVFYPNLGSIVEDTYSEGHIATVLTTMAYAIGIVLLLKFALHQFAYWRAPWLRKAAPEAARRGEKKKDYWEYDPEQHLAGLKMLYDAIEPDTPDAKVAAVAMRGVTARYGTFELRLPDLTIGQGDFVSVIGESGSGKTSLVELIAGIRMQDSVRGSIAIRGREVFHQDDWTCDPAQVGVGVVHQDFALFHTMTVRDNVWFGLERKLERIARDGRRAELPKIREIARTAQDELLRFLRLPVDRPFLDRYPAQLSGGQRQRVVLARALLAGNRVLVVDEGFANIDQPTRGRVREGVFRLATLLRLTVICVSHDNQDVLRNSTRIIYMVSQEEEGITVGHIARVATPREFFYHPHSVAAAYFIGHRNIFQARLVSDGANEDARLRLFAIDGDWERHVPAGGFEIRRGHALSDGPHFIPATWINPQLQAESGDDFYEGTVVSDHFLGESHEIVLRTRAGLLIHAVVQDDDYAKIRRAGDGELRGQTISFRIDGEPQPFAARTL
jgi:ABC-type Fe3+/spermidine/putrescine transport system ATPase subunit/ABC-type nitrate/sulfonate/bicarbonate transport system permease component